MPERGPLVDVVIPVHEASRPVERGVASVVDGTGAARAIVVCHDLDPSVFRERLAPFGDDAVLLPHADGVRSPAGPLNTGLEAATAPWVTCMGSDDHFAPGAPAAWSAHLRERPVDVLFLRTFHRESAGFEFLPVRAGRTRDLDVVKDRLSYRTGPQFLLRRALADGHGIRMTPGLPVGEDLGYSTHAYAVAAHMDLLPPSSPAYVVGNDGGQRVTKGEVDLLRQMAPPARLLEAPWLDAVAPRIRRSIAVRVLRQSVLPYVATKGRAASDAETAEVRRTILGWADAVPAMCQPLSLAEQAVVDAARDGADDTDLLQKAVQAVRGPLWRRGLPAHPRFALDPESRVRQLPAWLFRDTRGVPGPA